VVLGFEDDHRGPRQKAVRQRAQRNGRVPDEQHSVVGQGADEGVFVRLI